MGFKTDILQVEEIISDSTIVLETLTTEGITVTLNNITTPTDINASGGGITLKGTTDKTILWDDTNDNWTSNQHLNIATSKDYKINNVSVLNATTLGSNVVNSSLTSLGTITSLVATTADINAGTIDNTSIGATTPNTIVGTYITSIVAGTVKATTDLLTLTNSGNAADMDGTGTGILFNQYYYDGTPAIADSGRIAVITETDWTSTGTTQDSYMSFQTALDGTVAEKMRIASNGAVSIGGMAATANTKLDILMSDDAQTTGLLCRNNDGKIVLYNGTSTVNSFYPIIRGYSKGATLSTALIADIQSDDTGVVSGMILRSQIGNAVLATRPILAIQNYTTEVLKIAATGNVTITTASNPQITLTDSTAVTSGTVQYNSATESIDFIFS